jgi:DNA-binding CsgD family transcriptional regulator
VLDTCDDDRLRAVLGDGAARIAEIVPEVGRLSDLIPVKALESDQERFQLFRAIILVWQRVAEGRPLLLILDTLPWADPTSLRLLAFLATEMGQHRLLVLGTYRETGLSRQHPLTDTLAEFTRYPHFQRLRLTGLSRDETEQLMTSACGVSPPLWVAAMIHERTEGHPLFLVETVRYLLTEGLGTTLDRADASALTAIPTGVREVIGKRLNRLSAPCVRLLSIGACIGRAFPLDLLKPLVGESSEDAVLAALEEALAAQVLEPMPRANHYQFSHALIRETLYDELLAVRRVRLHQRIGELLEARHRDHIEPYLSQLAYHFGEAVSDGSADKALDYARRAAAHAAELLAHEEAARFYRQALQVQEHYFPQDKGCRCQLLLAMGVAQNWAGANESCQDTLLEAAALARELRSATAFVQAALAFEAAGWRSGRPGEQAAALLMEALAWPAPEARHDLRTQVDLLAAQCRAYIFCDRPDEAIAAYRRAVALARSIGEPYALFRALSALVPARFWSDPSGARLVAAREALAVAEQAGHPEWAVGDLTGWYMGDLVEIGDLAAAKKVVALHARVAEAMRQPYLMAAGLSGRTLIAIHEGRFAEAEALAVEMLALGRRNSLGNASGASGVQMFTLRREQGRLREVLPVFQHFVRTTPKAATWRPGLALLYAELDMKEEARAEFELLANGDFATISRDSLWLTCMTYLAEVCVYLADAPRAAMLYRLLLPSAGRNIVTGNVASYGAADRFLGMLAATLGQWDTAEHHFDAALAMDERTGGQPWLAHSRYQYAALLSRKHKTGTERALALLDAALATARELGMAMLEGRCVELKERLGGRPIWPDGLSTREVDVLRLIAAGRSNQEIGAQLFISANTVANHIHSILAKTSTANRTQAAAYAIRQGLTKG